MTISHENSYHFQLTFVHGPTFWPSFTCTNYDSKYHSIAFRTLSPELDEALANDDLGEILIHISATAIGIILAFRYSRVRDHEFRRSKAIDAYLEPTKWKIRASGKRGKWLFRG